MLKFNADNKKLYYVHYNFTDEIMVIYTKQLYWGLIRAQTHVSTVGSLSKLLLSAITETAKDSVLHHKSY